MTDPERICSIILAGGQGSRMRCASVHKVCFKVGGVPVILRTPKNRAHLSDIGR